MVFCPECFSENIRQDATETTDITSVSIRIPYTCNKCGCKFKHVYTLSYKCDYKNKYVDKWNRFNDD